MPRCDFKKVARNFIEIALRHDCSPVNLLHIFRTPFPKNTSGQLFLNGKSGWCTAQKMKFSVKDFFSKRDSGTGVFLWILRNFQEQLFFLYFDVCIFCWKSRHYRLAIVWNCTNMARSTTDIAISSASLSDRMSLVPKWKIIWSSLSRATGLIRSTMHLNFERWDCLTETYHFSLTTNEVSI